MKLERQIAQHRAPGRRLKVLSLLAALFASATTTQADEPRNPLDALRAYRYLQQICDLGPRISGSTAMEQQQQMLEKHFRQFGGEVTLQRFEAKNPLGGPNVPMANMIVRWHPERKERILLCTHFDTRPRPDRDPDPVQRKQGVFLGANDGGSGTAIFMELAHLMSDLNSKYGVDFVLFDGEELVYSDDDPYFVGSTYFAKDYAANPPANKYRWGVLLDMVGDADLDIYEEPISVSWQDTKPLVDQIWAIAGKLGVDEFIPRTRRGVRHSELEFAVRDDHLPLHNIAKIPTCDIIDFNYPAWHTTDDTPRRCAPSSLAKVGYVIYEWLKTAE